MAEERCCVCGRALPNRYAVAGRCEADGCGAAFCALHWNTRVRKCPAHGGGGRLPESKAEPAVCEQEKELKMEKPIENETEIRDQAKTQLTPEAKTSILKSVAEFTIALGKGASALIDRLRGVQDPDAALAALDATLAANRERREPLQRRYERLYGEIAAKKKVYMAAPPARKKILELELKALIAEYQGLERQLAVYFENERIATVVRTRTLELTAMGLRKLREKDIDELTNNLDNAVDEQAGVASALGDLEKAGRRTTSESDADAFADALAGFDEDAGVVTDAPVEAAEAVAAPSADGISAEAKGEEVPL